MGKSRSIVNLEKQEKDFRNYITDLQNQLQAKMNGTINSMNDSITQYYTSNSFTPIEFIEGQNADFMQKNEWSLENLNSIIVLIGKALFGDVSTTPSGVTIKNAEEIGKTIVALKDLKEYIMGQCFFIISGIIDSFGSSEQVTYNSSFKHEPIGSGLHLFCAVSSDSYKSTKFLNNKEIYEYLYSYKVIYSAEEALLQSNIQFTTLYQDQITVYISKENQLLNKFMNDEITSEQYTTQITILDKLLETSKNKLKELQSKKFNQKLKCLNK